MLAVEQLTKSFGAAPVLEGVSLSLNDGEILGLIGENGAGKSTFAKCLLGVHAPDSGIITLDGQPLRGRNEAISGIPQECNLLDDLTVAENIFLGREPRRFGLLDRRRMRDVTRRELTRVGAAFSPDAPVGNLSAAEKQLAEFAKALAFRSRVLIMDEPTTILSSEETGRLFALMREIAAAGTSILYISHKLAEVKTICDRVAILRDGLLVGCDDAAKLSTVEMAGRMVGRELSRMFPEPPPPPSPEPALVVRHLASPPAVRDAGFTLYRGEILGLAGLAGAGRSELAETIVGLRHCSGGTIELLGEPVRFPSPVQAFAAGVTLLPESRRESGVLPEFSVTDNILLPSLRRYTRHGILRGGRMRATAREYVRRFQIKPANPEVPLGNLSGGNQQKALMAKGVELQPKVFLFDEPTRGVDIAARLELYEMIRDLAAAGVACLVISSDLEELIGLCRRILVMREGEIAGELCGDAISEQNLMYLATGVTPNP